MEQLDLQLKRLHQKILLLIKQNQLLRKQNDLLLEANQKHEKIIAAKDASLKMLEDHLETLKLNASMLEKTDKKVLEKKIDAYLRDIEKCLAQLNA